MKILNLYAGIGGNRKLWKGHQITAIENNPEIAKIYQDFFPKDKVIVDNAHQYLLDHFEEYDFIWSSPPCPTHSRVRFMGTKAKHPTCGTIIDKKYPDMRLYQEIIFLTHYCKNKWLVENVKPYYKQLIPSQDIERHCFWSNFLIAQFNISGATHNSTIKEMGINKGFDISKYKIKHRKDVILRNCVLPELGKHILDCAMGEVKQKPLL